MTIGFILNGEDVVVRTNPENRLVNLLRGTFSLLGTKPGCYCGYCGSCSVILNGDVVKSCLIPAFKIHGSEIITIEGLSQTDEYHDIVSGYADSGITNCGFCDTAKILTTEALLGKNLRPSRDDILSAFGGIKCRCTDPESLVRGVMKVSEYRRLRTNGRSA